MAWSITERFPSWGESGEFPPTGFFYEGGDQVNEKHLDALWNGVNGLEEDVQGALNDIDSDGDGTVDESDSVADGGSLNGSLNDSAGNTLYNDTDKLVPANRIQQGSGSGLDADTVDGQEAANLGTSIGKLDSAETFTESDVTTSYGFARPINESLQLPDTVPSFTYTGFSDPYSVSSEFSGHEIVPKAPLTNITLRVASGVQANTLRIRKQSDGSTIASKSATPGSKQTFTGLSLVAGDTYLVEAGSSGGHTRRNNTSDQPAVDRSLFSLPSQRGYNIDYHAVETLPTSGSITVSWPDPADVYAWDRAIFQQTSNSGSVDVYIEESTDGGSTWTEVAGPISRGDNIPSSSDAEVRFRADFSRPTESDASTTVDAIYRRWLI